VSLARVIDLCLILSALALSVVLGPFARDPCRAVLTVGCSGPREGSDMGEFLVDGWPMVRNLLNLLGDPSETSLVLPPSLTVPSVVVAVRHRHLEESDALRTSV